MPTKNIINFDVFALFDAVMAEVEPDLMRKNIDTLDVKYKDESEEAKNARAKRYEAAYQEWKIRLKKIVTLWKKEVMNVRNQVLKKAKLKTAEAESDVLADIASTIDSL